MTISPVAATQVDLRQQEFVAAIHAVINGGRTLTEQELLITTACELLVDGALDSEDIARRVNEVWAGAKIPSENIQAALRTAVDAGLMVSTGTGTGGGELWSLTPAGRAGAGGAREWAESAYARTARQLQELADKDLRTISDVEARLWVDLLAQALSDGIREAYAAFVGDVTLLVDGTLTPKAFDRDQAFRALREANLDGGVTEFLEAAVLAALDRTDPFGNDLVNHIATGCILLGFLAGCDRGDVRKRLRDLAGEEFVLDTPALVMLAGSARDADPILRAIEATLACGGQVVVAEHTVEELIELVEAIGAEHIPAITEALRNGLNARAYCTTVSLPALETWVTALYEGRYQSWEAFEREAHQINQRLAGLGVTVRPHGNNAPETVRLCHDSLSKEFKGRQSSRAPAAIQRDANTMAMVLRHRVKREDNSRIWPGSWIVTTDRHIGPAYRKVSSRDAIPVTLSITQWAVIVMSCRQTTTAEELAAVAVPLVGHQAALAIAARYPSEVALEIAKVLAPGEGPASTDLRLAQLASSEESSIDIILDPKTGLPAGTTPLGLASDVIARRQKRMEAQRVASTARAEEDRERAEALAGQARQAAEREKYAREQAERELRDSAGEVTGLRSDLAEARQRVVEQQKLGRRKGWLAALIAICISVAIVAIVLGLYVLAGVTFLTALAVWKQGEDWIKDPDRNARGVLVAILIEALGLSQLFVHW